MQCPSLNVMVESYSQLPLPLRSSEIPSPHPPPPFGPGGKNRKRGKKPPPLFPSICRRSSDDDDDTDTSEKRRKKGSLCRESIICNRKKRSAFDYKDQLAPTIFLHYTVNNTRVYKYSGNPLCVAELPTFLPIIKWQQNSSLELEYFPGNCEEACP